jgi:TatD DNase family protein
VNLYLKYEGVKLLIDIHSHLDHQYFKDDIEKIISNAKKSNVSIILSAGIDSETNRKTLEIAKKYPIVKACLGFYPIQHKLNTGLNINSTDGKTKDKKEIDCLTEISNFDDEIKFIEKNKNNIVAIGEVGLDYSEQKVSKSQKILFECMIKLAEKLNKPIIVHSRKAENDCIEMLQSSKLKKIIMHCFSGKRSLVKKIVDNGWFLTAPTCIIRASQYQENVKLCPINQLFCETDSPYLSPYKAEESNFNINEPAFIVEAYKKVAEIKALELKEVINNIWMNWQQVF